MINEDITNKSINIEMKMAKVTARLILKALKKLANQAKEQGKTFKDFLDDKVKGSSVKLKDMVKKGQLENITLSEKGELKELKKELNRYGVNFSVMKDKETGEFHVFFQAKNTAILEKAFKNATNNFEKKEEKRESTMEAIKKFKEIVKNTISKDKIKNKQKEQSL